MKNGGRKWHEKWRKKWWKIGQKSDEKSCQKVAENWRKSCRKSDEKMGKKVAKNRLFSCCQKWLKITKNHEIWKKRILYKKIMFLRHFAWYVTKMKSRFWRVKWHFIFLHFCFWDFCIFWRFFTKNHVFFSIFWLFLNVEKSAEKWRKTGKNECRKSARKSCKIWQKNGAKKC